VSEAESTLNDRSLEDGEGLLSRIGTKFTKGLFAKPSGGKYGRR
jgi:hypothetical protein